MLVLTTMFVSVSNDLPKTSYMKMVDIWMIFNLIIPFVEVLLHVYKETFFGTEEEDDEMRSKPKTNIVQVESNENKEENVEMEIQVLINLSTGHFKISFFQDIKISRKPTSVEIVSRIVNPLVIVSFAVIYWVLGFVKYFNPSI